MYWASVTYCGKYFFFKLKTQCQGMIGKSPAPLDCIYYCNVRVRGDSRDY